MHLSRKRQRIVSALRKICRQEGVTLKILKGKTALAEGAECGGYFYGEKRLLVIAANPDEFYFFAVLFHEFGHFMQWRDYHRGRNTNRAKLWAAHSGSPNMLTSRTKYERKLGWLTTLAIETDAERTSIYLLKKYKIGAPSDRLTLIRTAALYLYCHRLMFEKRRWFKDNRPLNSWLADEKLAATLPATLRGVNFTRIPKKVRRLILPLF